MTFPDNERRDDIIYYLLNKAKHTEEAAQDISFYPDDFDDKVVEKADVQKHLQYVIENGYLNGSLADETAAGDDAPLAVCKNAQLTSEGSQVLRNKYFMV